MRTGVLLVGADGRLGRAIRQAFETSSEVSAIQQSEKWKLSIVALNREALDGTDVDAVRSAMEKYQPRIVINAAAYTDVGKAEAERRNKQSVAAVMRINAVIPDLLARAAVAFGAALIHLSTDYVFSGGGLRARSESDLAKPLGVYGRSKRAGERAIERVARTAPDFRWLIFRIGWLHGAPGDFVSKVLENALSGQLRYMRSNQWGKPTAYENVAAVILSAVLVLLGAREGSIKSGIYHYADAGPVVQRYQLARIILERGVVCLKKLGLEAEACCLRDASMHLVGFRCQDRARPSNCMLNCGKLKSSLLIDCYSWDYFVNKSVENCLQSRFNGISLKSEI